MTVHELMEHFESNMKLCVVKNGDASWWEYIVTVGSKYGGVIINPEDHAETFNALFHAELKDWVYREDGCLGIVI